MTQGGQALMNWLALRRTGRARAEEEASGQEQECAWTATALHQRYLADVFAYVARRVLPGTHGSIEAAMRGLGMTP